MFSVPELLPVKVSLRLSGEDKLQEFLWVGVIRKLESGLYGLDCTVNKISCVWVCVLCCCSSGTESYSVKLSCTGWKGWFRCSWMPLQRITSSCATHFLLRRCVTVGHILLWGGSSEFNPVLKVYQGSAGLCLTTLLLSAKAQILILLKTNLAKYLCLSLPLEHENYKWY